MTTPPIFLPGQTPTAEMLQALGSEPTDYTPALTAATTNPNLGADGEAEGVWVQLGHLVFYQFSFQFAGSGVDPGSGQYRVSLPVDVVSGAMSRVAIGSGRAIDASVATDLGSSVFVLEKLSTDPGQAVMPVEESVTISGANPWTWATGDRLFGQALYIGDL